MEFKDLAQNEASALLERLNSAAQAATQTVREDYEAQLASVRGQLDALREQLEKETARATAAESDLDTVIEAHKSVDAERISAETTRDQEAKARAAAEEEVRSLNAFLEKARTEIAQLEELLEAEMSEKAGVESQRASLQAELAAARSSIESIRAQQHAHEEAARELETKLAQAQAAEATIRKQSGDTNSLLQTLTTAADAATKKIREDADKELAAVRVELDAARREAAAAQKGKATDGKAPQPAFLAKSVLAIEALGQASTASDLLAGIVKQLSPEFPRVVVFRVKGKHLEGQHGAGLDAGTDITKLVIPMSMDSVITRAANLGTIEELKGKPSGKSPLGGTPAAAIALPVRFQGETLAVVYADADRPWDEAHTAFATILLRHADVLLTRLTQELKTLKELRDYAALLLQEAEHMFLADVDAKRPEKDRLRRLQETIDCGRQMYSQRAAFEGPIAASLLDEQIASAIAAQPSSPFAKDLAVATQQSQSKRNAS